MARVQDYYQNRRDLGKSSMVAYLDAWLTERSGMNKALMAPGKQADPGRLAEQEAKIRKAMADLMRAKVSGSVEEVRIASELAETALRGVAQITSAGANAASRVTVAKIGAKTRMVGNDLQMRRRVASDLTLSDPRTIAVVSKAYADSSADGRPTGPALVKKIDDLAAGFEDGDPAKRDAIAARVLAQAEAAGDRESARAIKKAFFEAGDDAGDDASDGIVDGYFARKYPEFTPEEHKKAREEIDKMSGGANPKGFIGFYDRLVADGAGGGGTKTSASSGGSGAGAAADPDAVLAGLEAAAEDLNAAWKAAMAPSRSPRFPRPNYMIANPNTYTDPREIQDLERWGVLDSKYVEEVAAARQSEGSWRGAVKAIGDRGGISQQVEHIAPLLLTNDEGVADTYPDAELRMVRAWTRRAVDGKGGYRYTLNDDGTITSQKPGGKPVTVVKGSAFFKAIVDELFAPDLLPGEVADLYAPARALAEDGSWAQAAEKARGVDPNNVRSAYAKAIRDVASGRIAFEGIAAERQMEALAASIGEGGGKWGEHFRALLDQPMQDEYGKKRVMGAVESLADAMEAAPAIEDRLREEDAEEAMYGLDEVIAGRDVSPEAYGRGKALGETAVKDMEGASDKRALAIESTLKLLDEWERKNPDTYSSLERSDSSMRKARDDRHATRLRLERELAQIRSKAQDALPENVDDTLTELKAGQLGTWTSRKGFIPLKGDEALGVQRAIEAKQDAMKAPKPPRPVTYLEETRPPPEPGLSESVAGDSDPDPKFDFYKKAREAQQLLKSLDQWETENPRPTDPRQLRGWEEAREGVEFTRKAAEKKLEASRSEMQPSLDIDLVRDRAAAAEAAEAAAAEAAAVPPPRIPPRAAATKSAPKRPPPVSAAKPPPGTFEDADLAALLSPKAAPSFEDADLAALLSPKAAPSFEDADLDALLSTKAMK
tara:strand:- start:14952 stop:17786 length:2835 start_codon:yes stop_codon:yes gene_type:complete